ncbi:MAG: transcriptional regulator, MarR family [Frankiales bacterium]|nr:transcriptional regulator, MarR family [Frankiales bacterium]
MTYAYHMGRSTVDTALASELRTTVMRLARRLRNQRTDDSLSLSQIATLGTLSRHGALTPSELAAHERVQPPSMTRLLAKLEEAGLVSRTDHPTDGRQVLVAVSDKGLAMIKADRRQRDAWLAQRMRDLTTEDLEVLRRAAAVLGRLADS